MEQLGQQNGARPSHLPSAQVQLSTKQMWVAGPRVNVSIYITLLSDHQLIKSYLYFILLYYSCFKISSSLNRRCDWANAPNTHAVFLFPWETNNGFHTFNDNVLSILSNIVLQYITSPKVSAKDTPRYILYEFNAVGRKYEGATSMLYDLLKVIFGWEYVRPVRELLRGGPHCVRQLSWASATKPIYRDTLVDLRRATSDVLAHILHAYKVEADHNATVANSIASTSSSTLQRTTKTVKSSIVRTPVQIVRTPGLIVRTPRVVIVTRNESVDPLRKLHPDSEYSMMRGFQRQGDAVEVCCNFTAVNTIALLLEHFQDVDICVGIHGAGLTNCAFARPGVVVVELQVFHAYGVQSFPKIAHMAGGDYVVHDLRGLRKVPGRSMYGIVLPEQTVQNVVDSAVRTYELRHPMVTALCAGTERSGAAAVPVLGGSSSGRAALQDAAPPSTLLGRWSTLMGKTAVQALLSNRTTETPPSLETAVQTHCKHTAPVGTSIAYTQPWRTLLQNAHLLVVVPKLKHIYIHPKDQPSPVTFDAHTLALSGFPGHSFHHIEAHLRSGEGQLHRTEHLAKFLKKPVRNYVARNNGTYWIVPNPSDAPYTKVSTGYERGHFRQC